MLYSDYINALAAALPMQVTDATTDAPFATNEYNLALPRGIEYAELRMLRDPDLDFLAVRQSIGNLSLTQNNRSFVMPDKLIVLDRLAVFTPVGTTPQNGTRNLLVPASADVIDFFYAGAATGVPQYWAPIYDSSQGALSGYKWIAVGPAPDQNYAVEAYGPTRPMPLSSANPQTFISANMPDVFFAASMIWWSAFQKNFTAQGAESGNAPQMTSSWEGLYEGLKKGAAVEEARKKAQSAQWTTQPPTPVATPPRV